MDTSRKVKGFFFLLNSLPRNFSFLSDSCVDSLNIQIRKRERIAVVMNVGLWIEGQNNMHKDLMSLRDFFFFFKALT